MTKKSLFIVDLLAGVSFSCQQDNDTRPSNDEPIAYNFTRNGQSP